jgi:lysophospholipase L1-like esterase
MGILKNGTQRYPKAAIAVWLVQLIFPALVLIPVLIRLRNQEVLGQFTWAVLGLALAWYAFCFLILSVPGMRLWILTHPAQLITLYASATLGLVVSEMFCRYRIESTWEKRPEPPVPHTEYSPELGWKPRPGRDGIGEHGWRGPCRTAAKAKDRFRIVCVGDSTTYGLSYSWDASWPHQLETLLNADSSWTTAHGVTEVLNLGGPGYGTDQELLALKKHGLLFQPDLVILHLCVNDFADVSNDYDWLVWMEVTRYKPFFELKGDRVVLKRNYAPPPRYPSGKAYQPGEKPSLGLWSALLYRIGQFLEDGDRRARRNNPRWPIIANFRPEYTEARPLVWALVREMAKTSSEVGSQFLVTLSPTLMKTAIDAPPVRVGSFLQEYQADAAVAGVPAISCVAEYFAKGGNAQFLSAPDPYHLNRQGNALVAQHTMRWLKENIPAAR